MCNHKLMGFGADENGNYRICGRCGKKIYIITNADRIRAMSDEELAEHIWPKFGCPDGKNNVTCGYVGECRDCWLDWLQKPAEEAP